MYYTFWYTMCCLCTIYRILGVASMETVLCMWQFTHWTDNATLWLGVQMTYNACRCCLDSLCYLLIELLNDVLHWLIFQSSEVCNPPAPLPNIISFEWILRKSVRHAGNYTAHPCIARFTLPMTLVLWEVMNTVYEWHGFNIYTPRPVWAKWIFVIIS